jgi:hypothetical protein
MATRRANGSDAAGGSSGRTRSGLSHEHAIIALTEKPWELEDESCATLHEITCCMCLACERCNTRWGLHGDCDISELRKLGAPSKKKNKSRAPPQADFNLVPLRLVWYLRLYCGIAIDVMSKSATERNVVLVLRFTTITRTKKLAAYLLAAAIDRYGRRDGGAVCLDDFKKVSRLECPADDALDKIAFARACPATTERAGCVVKDALW